MGLTDIVTECKFMCPTDNEAKRYRNVGVWSRERFIAGPGKETGDLCPSKNPKLPEEFQHSMFKGQVREGRPRGCDQLVRNFLIG